MIKKKILVDIDGVIAEFHKDYLGFVNRELQSDYTFADWRGKEFVGMVAGLNSKLHEKYIQQGRYKRLKIIPKAKEGLYNISKKRKIVLCTSRTPELAYDTIRWLQNRGITYPIHFEPSKVWFCHQHGIDSLVEDDVSMVSLALKSEVNAYGILRPYNDMDLRLMSRERSVGAGNKTELFVCKGLVMVAEHLRKE